MFESMNMTRRGYGHISDYEHVVEHDLIHAPIVRLPGYVHVGDTPKELDYTPLLERYGDGVPNQGGTSSCVGNALSTCIFLRAAIMGKPILRPSRKLIYDLARLIDVPHRVMIDQGSRPMAAILGSQQYGLVAESRWPLTEEEINANAPEDVFQHALDAKVGSYYRIKSGFGCSYAIRHALASGFCPMFAMPVDDMYENYDGSSFYEGVTHEVLGSHMQAIVGFTAQNEILVCNSWGTGWGTRGIARISDAWFDSGSVSDVIVPTVVPGRVT